MTRSMHVVTDALDIAFECQGPERGWPVILLHGFPYDVRSYDEVALELAGRGAHVVVPYLRGYGLTRFVDGNRVRSGQQAALAHDLRDLIIASGLDQPIVTGFDWGGRAACIVAMLWPELVAGLVTIGGYNVHDIRAMSSTPEPPHIESRNWYQWYFHSERGRQGLIQNRCEIARQLWCEWSPNWAFDDATFRRTAGSFTNPDFVDVVVHSYRHRYGLSAGDPEYEESEQVIAGAPPITVPTIVIDPTDDPILEPLPTHAEHASHFTRLVDHRLLQVGHNTPAEAPQAVAQAVRDLYSSLPPR